MTRAKKVQRIYSLTGNPDVNQDRLADNIKSCITDPYLIGTIYEGYKADGFFGDTPESLKKREERSDRILNAILSHLYYCLVAFIAAICVQGAFRLNVGETEAIVLLSIGILNIALLIGMIVTDHIKAILQK
jgi:hypothetical protein